MRRFRSIQAELILAFTAIVTVVIGVAIVVNLVATRKIVEKAIREDLDQTVRRTAERIDGALYGKISELRNIASTPSIIEAAELGRKKSEYMGLTKVDNEGLKRRFGKSKMLNISPKALSYLKKLVDRNQSILDIYFTDIYGINVAVTGPVTKLGHWDDFWWNATMKSGHFLGSFELIESSNRYSFSVAVPIPHPQTGKPNGVLKAIFDFSDIESIVNKIQLGSSGRIVTYSPDYQVITHPIKTMRYSMISQDDAFAPLIDAIESTEAGSFNLDLPLHNASKPSPLIVSFTRTSGLKEFKGLGWIVTAQISEEELLAPVQQAESFILLVGAGTILLSSVLIGIISWRFARHIRRLTRATERLGRGDLDTRLTVTTSNELGQLDFAFNEMARSLKAAMEEIEAIVQYVADGVVVLDANGRIEQANHGAFALLDIKPEDVGEAKLLTILKDNNLICTFEDVFASDTETSCFEVCRAETEDSNSLYLEANLTKINGDGGHLIRAVLSLRNITQERQEEALRSEFLSTVSHKLKTPLTVIQGWASVLQISDLESLDEDTRAGVNEINDRASELGILVDRILSFSELCVEIDNLNKTSVQPDQLVSMMENIVKEIEAEKVCNLSCSTGSSLPMVAIHSELIELVLRNLAENAVKFCDKETLELGFEIEDRYGNLHVKVSDNGTGIPSELRESIFDGFYQSEKFFTGNTGGAGLGLPLVRRIVQAHGGVVWADSKLSEGSSFTFTLPTVSSSESGPSLPKKGVAG